MTYDAVVVGAGLAGLTAAVRLAEQGRSVLVVAKGAGATHLAPPTIDVLGYSRDGEAVESPARGLAELMEASPEHPYARVGQETAAAALDWYRTALSELGYTGGLDANMLLPTAAGAAKPSALCPATMAGGDVRSGGRMAIVGLRGLKDFHARYVAGRVHRELEERLRTKVFEIALLPPSVPGMRLFEVLKGALRRGGGRLILGHRVIGAEDNGRRVEAVLGQTPARSVAYRACAFVLATGGFASGGLELDSAGAVRETVLGLPVAGVPPPGEARFLPGYFDRHPLARAGLEVDGRMRPLGPDGPVYENLHAAGAALAGAEPWREASGNGISVATGFAAAQAILEGRE
jgi:anaerobic glycerol-3-phosphate dehydrogenase